MGERRRPDLAPWNEVIGIRLELFKPPIKFRFLSLSRARNRITFGDAIPQRLRQLKLVLDAQLTGLGKKLCVHE